MPRIGPAIGNGSKVGTIGSPGSITGGRSSSDLGGGSVELVMLTAFWIRFCHILVNQKIISYSQGLFKARSDLRKMQ